LILTIGDRMFIYDGEDWSGLMMPFGGNRWCRNVCTYRDTLYGGAEQGRLYRWFPGWGWRGSGQLGLDPDAEEIEALVNYYGRLYVGTTSTLPDTLGEGRLYVSAAIPWGCLESAVCDFGTRTTNGVLSWDAFVPEQGDNAVRLQVRSASEISALWSEPFRGPDGTAGSYFEEPGTPLSGYHIGDQYFQYAVELLCPEGFRMPFVTSVTLEADSLTLAAIDPAAAVSPAVLHLRPPRPNPARDYATIEIESARSVPSGALRVRILDVRGRLVRLARLVSPGAGSVRWTWDLRDGRGRRVPSGVYEVTVGSERAGALPGAAGSRMPARRVVVLP
jgi:hypothetical protein